MTVYHFHRLKIGEVRRETEDAISVRFDVPENLTETFAFKHGQHLTLRAIIDGEELRRNYSICSGVDDDEIRVAIRRLRGGRFSTFANDHFKAGDEIDVMPAKGRFFTPLDPAHKQHYLAIAAGAGITPVLSIIKTTLAREPGSDFTLIYGNRNAASIMLRDPLTYLKNRYPERFHLIHVLSREQRDVPLFNGRIDPAKLEALGERLVAFEQMDEVFLCGPQKMIDALRPALSDQMGIDKKHVHFELFGTEDQLRAKPVTPSAAKGPRRRVTVIADGKQTRIELATEGQSILDAALAGGADLPFACKGGVCCTCRAKLLSGEVKMDVNYALEDDEVQDGFVLTCQSHPMTDEVVVDFDAR